MQQNGLCQSTEERLDPSLSFGARGVKRKQCGLGHVASAEREAGICNGEGDNSKETNPEMFLEPFRTP